MDVERSALPPSERVYQVRRDHRSYRVVRPTTRHAIVMGSAILMSLLAGCSLPDTYSLARSDQTPPGFDEDGYASLRSFRPKAGFGNLLAHICDPDRLPAPSDDPTPSSSKLCKEKSPATDFACWADTHRTAKACLDAVTLHAVDQCSVLVGRQNAFAARFTRWLFPIQALLSVTADAAAISAASASNGTPTTALTAVALSNSGDLQKTAPSIQTLKVGDFVANEMQYVLIGDFRNADVYAAQAYPAEKAAPSILKFSRFHDAVLGSCPAYNP